MPKQDQIDASLLECMVSGLCESCQNIRLSRLMKGVMLPFYARLSEQELGRLVLDAFGRAGRRKLRQDEFLRSLKTLLKGQEEGTCLAAQEAKNQRFTRSLLSCSYAIWLKEEARELRMISRCGEFLSVPATRETPDMTLAERRNLVALMLAEPPDLSCDQTRKQRGNYIEDVPYVVNVKDVASFISRAFRSRNIQAEFLGAIVPNFYRKRTMYNDMRPQQYLATLVSILAEMLPDGAILTIDVTPDFFVFESPAFVRPLCLDATKVWFEGQRDKADSELLAACYPLWANSDLILNPLAVSVPVASAERIRHKIGGDAVYQVQQLLERGTKLRMRKLSKDNISAITDLIRRSDMGSFVWATLKTLDSQVNFVSLPAVFRELLSSKRTQARNCTRSRQ